MANNLNGIKNIKVIAGDREFPLEIAKDSELIFTDINKKAELEEVFDSLIHEGTTITATLDGKVKIEIEEEIPSGMCENCSVNKKCKGAIVKKIKRLLPIENCIKEIEKCECKEEKTEFTGIAELINMAEGLSQDSIDIIINNSLLQMAKDIFDNLIPPTNEEIDQISVALENTNIIDALPIIQKVTDMFELFTSIDELEGNISGTTAMEVAHKMLKGLELFEVIQKDLGLTEIVLNDSIIEEKLTVLDQKVGEPPMKPYCYYRNKRTLYKRVVRNEITDRNTGELISYGECSLQETKGDLATAEILAYYRAKMNHIEHSTEGMLNILNK